MSFVITARTILHLGSDLISSDAVALYELIKNAIDAGSPTGVDIQFDIVIREADFAAAMSALEEAEEEHVSLAELKDSFLTHVTMDADAQLKSDFISSIERSHTAAELRHNVVQAYSRCNRIIVSDTGHGMSRRDLQDVYLTIGTTSRAKEVRKALEDGAKGKAAARPPYLGEKGVGRLSVMRLGWRVRVETMTEEEDESSILEIDWKDFERADDAEASSIPVSPKRGVPRTAEGSFTRIEISDLRSSWSLGRLAQVANQQIARMTDPFSWKGRRFQIRLAINGHRLAPVSQVAKAFLGNAHGRCIGSFEVSDGPPKLVATVESALYGGDPKEIVFDTTDLMLMSGLRDTGHSSSILRRLGSFSFEFYWFNRQRLRALPDVGDREVVKDLVRTWAGVCLFRDGYRVLPYGDPGDDWLGLDLTALASSGYKLNTKQIIGRVSIGRLTNSRLLDQTNRQGLIETPEKEAMINLLRELVSRWWHDYLNEASNAKKKQEALAFDAGEENTVVESLEARTKHSLREIRKNFHGDAQLLREVKDAFAEIKEAHLRAVEHISAIEEQKERLTQLAGVGLLVEVIAHELARATELTQATLKDLSRRNIDGEAASALRTLGTQVKVIQKRLKALEPLSVSARFRRSHMKLNEIVRYVLEGHTAQFERHRINLAMSKDDEDVSAFVVEGHVVQILENLISNSVYWLELEEREHPAFVAEIAISVKDNPPRIRYSDNGPGIPASRRDSVFEPFFSTKQGAKSRRFGLGLYIARQNAEMLGGTLELVDQGSIRSNRYNVFELTLKEGPDES